MYEKYTEMYKKLINISHYTRYLRNNWNLNKEHKENSNIIVGKGQTRGRTGLSIKRVDKG